MLEAFTHNNGQFQKQGAVWLETAPPGGPLIATFEEIFRNGTFVILYDATRMFLLRLPFAGGYSVWTAFDQNSWFDLYDETYYPPT